MGEITSLRGYTRHISLAGHRCVTLRGLSFVPTRGSTLVCSLMNGEKETMVGEFLLAEKIYFSMFYEENVSCGSAMSLDDDEPISCWPITHPEFSGFLCLPMELLRERFD